MGIYLNNAATSWPKPECVYLAVDHFLRNYGPSQGRGSFESSREATNIIENCRSLVARLFQVPDRSRFVFTKNCSEALNLAIKGFLRKGDHVITSSMEHNSVWRPLKSLEKKGIISLTEVLCNGQGEINLDDVGNAFRPETRLLVFTHASNVTGTVFPIAELAELAHSRKACLLVDAAQTAGSYPLNLQELNVDILACSGHKGLLGPQGTGVLYLSQGLELEPLLEGGTGSNSLSPDQPDYLPDRFETGTPNGPGLAGLGAALEFIQNTGVENIHDKERSLTALLLGKLCSIPGVVVYGPRDPERQISVVSFNIQGVNPEEVGTVLDEVFEIMVRTGLHCAPCAHRTIGTVSTGGTVRVSPGYFNSIEEINIFIEAVKEIALKSGHYTCPSRKPEAVESGDYIQGFKVQQTAPCYSEQGKIRIFASLTDDIGELLPYLNAVVRGNYQQNAGRFTFTYQGSPVVLQGRQIVLGRTESLEKGKQSIAEIVKMLNRVAAARHKITPSTEPQIQISPYALYSHLPKTNCRKCGEMTCLAFAAALVQGRCVPDQCPRLKDSVYENQRKKIEEMLSGHTSSLLSTGEELKL